MRKKESTLTIATTEDLIRYQASQKELRDIIEELHRPLFDIGFGLIFFPVLFFFLKSLLGIAVIENTLRPKIRDAVFDFLKTLPEAWEQNIHNKEAFYKYLEAVTGYKVTATLTEKEELLEVLTDFGIRLFTRKFEYLFSILLLVPASRFIKNQYLKFRPLGLLSQKSNLFALAPQHLPPNTQTLRKMQSDIDRVITTQTPYRNYLRFMMRFVLILSIAFSIYTWRESYLLMNKKYLFSMDDFFNIFLNVLIISYASRGILTEILQVLEERTSRKVIEKNKELLHTFKTNLGVTNCEFKPFKGKSKGVFLLQFPKAIVINKQPIDKKILISSLVETLTKEKIEISFFDRDVLVIPANKALPKHLNTHIAQKIKEAVFSQWKTHKNEKEFDKSVRKFFGGHQNLEKTSSEKNGLSQYYLTLDTSHALDEKTLSVLQSTFGKEFVQINQTSENFTVIISQNPAKTYDSSNIQLPTITSPLPTVAAAQFLSTSPQSISSIALPKPKPLVTKAESHYPTTTHTSTKPLRISFGKWGEYDSQHDTKIKMISASSWNKENSRHFMLFNADETMFNDRKEYDKFKTIEARVVGPKATKGVVKAKDYRVLFPDGKHHETSYKLKDPSSPFRVFARDEKHKDKEGNEVTLHIFDGVLKTH